MGATVLPTLDEIDPVRFLPSSRSVAFTRSAWEASGGYPEWLDYCEDLIFDFRLRDLYQPFAFAPQAVVHFRPRSSLPSFFKQYYQYARGDGKADLWRKRHAIRYLTYLVLGPLLVILALLHSPWWWLALAAGLAAYTTTPYRRLWPLLAPYGFFQRIKGVLLVPVIRQRTDHGYRPMLLLRQGQQAVVVLQQHTAALGGPACDREMRVVQQRRQRRRGIARLVK